jgi:hypothetical protein
MNKKITTSLMVTGIIAAILAVNGGCRKGHNPPEPGKVITGNSTIVYTDVNPDSTIHVSLTSTYGIGYKIYDLDLNNDGINDFEFRVIAISSRGGGERPISSSSVIVSTLSDSNGNQVAVDSGRIRILDSLASIGNAAETWASGVSNLLGTGVAWARDTAYLGLKLIKGSDTFYGWVRLANVRRTGGRLAATMTILDYAYDSTPNHRIFAGQTK